MMFTRKVFLRRLASLVLCPVLALSLCGAGQKPRERRITYSKAEVRTLDALSAYLNGIKTLKGRFTQISPQGQISRGTFYLQHPGRVRFAYDPPSPVLVVSDGKTIAVANSRLKTVDHYSLSNTPFGFLFTGDIDLRRSGQVLGVDSEPGLVTVRARTSLHRYDSDVRFVFSAPDYELRQWTVTDAQGLTTTVALDSLTPGAKIPADAFVLPKGSAAPKKRILPPPGN